MGAPVLTVVDAAGNPVTSSSPEGTYTIAISAGNLAATSANYNPLVAADFVNGTFQVGLLQTIQFPTIPNTGSLAYGAPPITLSAASVDSSTGNPTGLQVGYTVTGPASIAGSILSITGAGPVVVTAVQTGAGGYTPATPVSQSFNVNPATLTVAATSLTLAQNANLPSPLPFTFTGLLTANGDTPASISTGSPALTITDQKGNSVTSTANLGTDTINISQGTLALITPNYVFASSNAFVPGTLTVVAGTTQTISFNPIPTQTYGVGTITLNASASSGQPVTFSYVSGPATVVNNQLTVTGAGTVVVQATQGGNTTYTAATAQQTITVNPAVLTVTAADATRADNTVNPAFTGMITGYVNGDNSTAIGGTPAYSTTATPQSPAGTYPITPSQGSLAAANYTFAFVNGTLTVTSGGPVSDYSLSLATGQLLIIAGGGTNTDITLTPSNYYAGTVNLSCGKLPANMVCVFSPVALSSDGTDPANAIVTVNTNTSIVGQTRTQNSSIQYASLLWPLGGLAGLLVALARKRLNRYPTYWTAILILTTLTAAVGLNACGSSKPSSSAAGGAGATAPGTYTISIEATDTAGGPSHSIPLVVQVQ